MSTFLSDTFTDTAGTLLENHTPDIGSTWSKIAGAGSIDITLGGKARLASTISGTVLYSNSADPVYEEYSVTATVTSSGETSTSQVVGVIARKQSGADTYYRAYLIGGASGSRGAKLDKVVAGTVTNLGTYLFDWVASTNYTIKLEVNNSAKKVYIDGVERISSFDNAITNKGTAGLYGVGDGATARTWDGLSGVRLPYNETGKLVIQVAPITLGQAIWNAKELGKAITSIGVLASSDAGNFQELNKAIIGVSMPSASDAFAMGESGKLVTLVVIVKEQDIGNKWNPVLPVEEEFTKLSWGSGGFTKQSANTGGFTKVVPNA